MINLKELRKYKDSIKSDIENLRFEEAIKKIKQYENKIEKDIDILTMKALIEFQTGNLDEAEKCLLDNYDKFEMNFDMNYNLAIINIYKNDKFKAVEYLIKSMLIDSSKEDNLREEIDKLLATEEDIDMFIKTKKELMARHSTYTKVFPIKNDAETYWGKYIEANNKQFYCGIYDVYAPAKDGLLLDELKNAESLLKTEVLRGKRTKEDKFKLKKDSIIPIMKLKNTDLILNVDGNEYSLNSNLTNRYYYYKGIEDSNFILKSDDEFVIGDIIELGIDETKPKLVLNIFIDGLSQEVIKDENLEKYMPNTYKFFKTGTICENAYVTGEWTHVSLASIFTGMYTTNHRVYHPQYDTENIFNKKIYTEVLNKNGYFCSKIDGNWRSTPSLGYVKGIDRAIYQSNMRGMFSKDIVSEIVENLETFKEKNNFLWTCIFDLHDVSDEVELDSSCQVNCSLESRFVKTTKETSVRKGYHPSKIEKYKLQLKRMDTYLEMLFHYIESNFSEDEILITMFSDHGQGYILDDDEFLGSKRTHIPFMIKGKNIPNGICNEVISSIDIFPIILNTLGIDNYDINDGNIPKYFGGHKEREYAITESIFPGSPYRIAINDLEHTFILETDKDCTNDGRIYMDNFNIKLINKQNNKDERELYLDKVENYIEITFEHIKNYIII